MFSYFFLISYSYLFLHTWELFTCLFGVCRCHPLTRSLTHSLTHSLIFGEFVRARLYVFISFLSFWLLTTSFLPFLCFLQALTQQYCFTSDIDAAYFSLSLSFWRDALRLAATLLCFCLFSFFLSFFPSFLLSFFPVLSTFVVSGSMRLLSGGMRYVWQRCSFPFFFLSFFLFLSFVCLFLSRCATLLQGQLQKVYQRQWQGILPSVRWCRSWWR